jgi:serine/threonine-protein kinase
MTALSLASWLVTGHHVPDVLGEFLVFMVCLCGSVTLGLFVGALYLALEPYVRKLWPESVISWTRLLAGCFRDPLVGRDVLVGLSALGANWLASDIVLWLLMKLDLAPVSFFGSAPLDALRGGRYALEGPLSATTGAIFAALLGLMLFLVLRIVFRRPWLAAVGFCVLYIAGGTVNTAAVSSPGQIVGTVVLNTIDSITFLIVMTRFGLVALIAYHWIGILILAYPFVGTVFGPYFALSLVPPLVFLVLAVYGYRVSVAGQPLFRDDQAAPHR